MLRTPLWLWASIPHRIESLGKKLEGNLNHVASFCFYVTCQRLSGFTRIHQVDNLFNYMFKGIWSVYDIFNVQCVWIPWCLFARIWRNDYRCLNDIMFGTVLLPQLKIKESVEVLLSPKYKWLSNMASNGINKISEIPQQFHFRSFNLGVHITTRKHPKWWTFLFHPPLKNKHVSSLNYDDGPVPEGTASLIFAKDSNLQGGPLRFL